jgi:hypothetical protein
MRMRIAGSVLLLVLLAAGCTYVGGSGVKLEEGIGEQNDGKTSLVFGFIDMADADTGMKWATLREVGPQKGKDPDSDMRVREGIFYLENVKSGSYIIAQFGGRKFGVFCGGNLFCSRPYNYDPGTSLRVVIKDPGIYFLGAYKWSEVKTGIFEANKFDLKPLDAPGGDELARKLAEAAKGTKWEAKLHSVHFSSDAKAAAGGKK